MDYQLEITEKGKIKNPYKQSKFRECSISSFLRKLDRLVDKVVYVPNEDYYGDFDIIRKVAVGKDDNSYYFDTSFNEHLYSEKRYNINISTSIYGDMLRPKLEELVTRSEKIGHELYIMRKFKGLYGYEKASEEDLNVILKHLKKFRNIRRIYEALTLLSIFLAQGLFVLLNYCLDALDFVNFIPFQLVTIFCVISVIPLSKIFRPFYINKAVNKDINRIMKAIERRKQPSVSKCNTVVQGVDKKEEVCNFKNEARESDIYVETFTHFVNHSITNILKLDKTLQRDKLVKLQAIFTAYLGKIRKLDKKVYGSKKVRHSLMNDITLNSLRELRKLDIEILNIGLTTNEVSQELFKDNLDAEDLCQSIGDYINVVGQDEKDTTSSAQTSKVLVRGTH